MVSIRLALALVVILAFLGLSVEAGYKKPPFNGSIFGKRSSAATDLEVASRALSALCEVASETCTAWASRQESK